MASTIHFVISCEHGGNRIPTQYRHLFHGFEDLLYSHRGYDRGALRMAKDLAQLLNASLFVSTTSRLLIDLNRSIGHPQLFSDATKYISASIRQEILTRYYLPYRNRVEKTIAEAINRRDRVIHISSHSFTPVLDGVVRHADIGLLYDPSRLAECDLCCRWQVSLKTKAPYLTIRRNYPYAGKADGLTTYLRRQFPAEAYLGIELEINQKHVSGSGQRWQALRHLVLKALHDVVR